MASSASIGAIKGGKVAVAVTLDDSKFALGIAKVKTSLRTLSAGLNTFSNSVLKMGAAIGVPLAAAMRQFSDFDHQMRVVNAVTQASEAEFERLVNRARELGKTTSWTAREVAEGMTSLGRMGWKPKEIDEAIGAMMDLARATDADIGIVSTLASNTMRAFKAVSGEAQHYADVLTVAANKSSQTVVDIGEAMTIVGPLAHQAGQSFEDTAAALMVMANNGVRGSIAGTALRNALVKLNDSARQDTLKRYNIRVKDAYGNMRKLVDILGDLNRNTQGLGTGDLTELYAELFGLRGMLGGVVLTNNIGEAERAKEAVAKAGGEANRVSREIEDGLWGAVKIAVSAFHDLSLEIAKTFSPEIISALDKLKNILRAFSSWAKQNKEQVKQVARWIWDAVKAALALKVALKLGAAIGGISKIVTVFGKLSASILAAKTATEGLAVAQASLETAGVGASAIAAGAGAAAGGGAVAARAAAGGGTMEAAVNGSILAGMLGVGRPKVRDAIASYRASKKQVEALRQEAAAKADSARAAISNANSAKREVSSARQALRAAQDNVAAQDALRRAARQSEQAIAGEARALRKAIAERGVSIREVGGQIDAQNYFLRNLRRGASGKSGTAFIENRAAQQNIVNIRQGLYRQRSALRAEQAALQNELAATVARQEEAALRAQELLHATRQARGSVLAAGNKLGISEQAAVAASKVAEAEKASSVAANGALAAGVLGSKQAGASVFASIAGLLSKVAIMAEVVMGVYALMKVWENWQKEKLAKIAREQEQRDELKEASKQAREEFADVDEETGEVSLKYREELDGIRRDMGELLGLVEYQRRGKLTDAGRRRMMDLAYGFTSGDMEAANALVASGNDADFIDAMQRKMLDALDLQWEAANRARGLAADYAKANGLDISVHPEDYALTEIEKERERIRQERKRQQRMMAMSAFGLVGGLVGSVAGYKYAANRNESDGYQLGSGGQRTMAMKIADEALIEIDRRQGQIKNGEGLGGIIRRLPESGTALPPISDLSELETAFSESVLSQYEKTIAELSKRQVEYANLIEEKTAELERRIGTDAFTTADEQRLRAEIDRLKGSLSAFTAQVEGRKLDAAREENLSRTDRVASAVMEAIRQRADMGVEGKQLAEALRKEWIGRFEARIGKLLEQLDRAQKEAASVFSESGEKVSENEKKRIAMLSDTFLRTAAKLQELQNLEVEDVSSRASSVTGSFKAGEVFANITAANEYDKKTAENTKRLNQLSERQIRISEAQSRLLEEIASNSGQVYA